MSWLDERKKGLGGTDVSAILGLNEYKNAFDVWAEKTNRVGSIEDNDAMKRGRLIEKTIVEYLEGEISMILQSDGENILFVDRENPIFIGTPDRLAKLENGDEIVIECKSTKHIIDVSDVSLLPFSWYCQVQWYLMLTGRNKALLGVFDGTFNFKHCWINRSDKNIQFLREKAEQFWLNHIITDASPEITNITQARIAFPMSVGSTKTVSEDIIELAWLIKQKKNQVSEIETEIESLTTNLLVQFEENEVISNRDGHTVATWKNNKDSMVFDSKKFESENKELFEKYLVQKKGARVLRIK